jgi:putative glutamine amidotransferase
MASRPLIIIRSRYFLSLLIGLRCFAASGQTESTDTVLIFNPTVENIQTITYLVQENILPLKSVWFMGIYHEEERYDYIQSAAYLERHPETPFTLFPVVADFSQEELFGVHAGTAVFRELFNTSSGAIFPGGPDLPPETYNEPMHLQTRVTDPWRHYLELSFVFHLLGGSQNPQFRAFLEDRPGYGILGICLGMQTLNVGSGGTLIQDIPWELYGQTTREEIVSADPRTVHRNYTYDQPLDSIYLTSYHVHPISVPKHSPLFRFVAAGGNQDPLVLSSHHQSIERLGKGLQVAAYSEDGRIIEAIAHTSYPSVLGVQFHPEKEYIFNAETVHHVNADSTINFNRYLSDKKSTTFHREFWKGVAESMDRKE